jgi:hypothetical protein
MTLEDAGEDQIAHQQRRMERLHRVAPALERILGDHRAGEAQAGGALQLLGRVRDVVQVDHRDALQSGGIGAAARTAALRAFRGSASQSLYARKMADISSGSATLK